MALWNKLGSRGKVEDRRSLGPVFGGGLGLTGIVVLLLVNFLGGGDVTDVLPELTDALVQTTENYNTSDFEGADSYEVFASTVVGSNNDMWKTIFAQSGQVHEEPRLVLFREVTTSACGSAVSQVGPHYCPLDKTIYLDETFFEEMTQRLGAPGGDVAEAYVIAHEAGHHAQNEFGIMSQIKASADSDSNLENELSIKLELQADCFAGLWAYSIKDLGVFLPGEINEAIDAARSVGDDRLQQATTGRVNPELWTHGSSVQRIEWFNRGYNSGTLSACDTFN
ncbi:MAG: neutral zinc metallopeptidase [bacterium]|nr:neutral zinc metallopeptidase [bacterium]